MNFVKFLFKQIDYFGYLPQNSYRNKNAIKIAKNVIYSDKCNSTLDIYCQKDTQSSTTPVVINLHGGGFVAGDKKYRKSFSEYLTKFNVKVINANYGLVPKYNITQILNELISIFDWIKNNNEKYGLDKEKIILCGDSAGAYLATCICALAVNEEYSKLINLSKIDTKIIGLVLFSGIYYPTQSLEMNMPFSLNHTLWEYFSGEKFVNIEECKRHKIYNFMDVANFVNDAFPPIFIAHSQKDIFCGDNGKKMLDKIKECNIPFFEVCSFDDMHDWQENMFTKSAKLTLAHFDSYMTWLLGDNSIQPENTSIFISKNKIVTNK